MISQEKVDQFEIQGGQDIPPGLTAELLANLHDVVQKFGAVDQDAPVQRIYLDAPHEVYVSASNDSNRKMMIIVGEGGQASHGAHVIRVLGSNPDIVIWDKRVTVEAVKCFIEAIDIIAKEHGPIDPATGERKQTNRSTDGGKRSVETTFHQPGVVVLVLPGGLSAKECLDSFDHPELLMIVEMPGGGGEVIVKKDDYNYRQRREQVVHSILKEEGVDIDSLSTLPVERIFEIRAKIEQRMVQ